MLLTPRLCVSRTQAQSVINGLGNLPAGGEIARAYTDKTLAKKPELAKLFMMDVAMLFEWQSVPLLPWGDAACCAGSVRVWIAGVGAVWWILCERER